MFFFPTLGGPSKETKKMVAEHRCFWETFSPGDGGGGDIVDCGGAYGWEARGRRGGG